MIRLTVAPCFGSGILTVVLFFLLAALLFLVPVRRDNFSPRRRRILTALRAAVLVLYAVLLLRPSALIETKTPLPSVLLVAADTSESMSAADGRDGKTRYEALKEALDSASGQFEALNQTGSIEAFSFDAAPVPIGITQGHLDLPEKAEGKETRLGSVLPAILSRTAGKRILGLILLSDGTACSSLAKEPLVQDAVFRFRDRGIPVCPVLFGETQGGTALRDLSIAELTLPDRVFAENTLRIGGTVHASGMAGERTALRLMVENPQGEMETVEQTEITIEEPDAVVPYQFLYTPKTPGEWKVTVAAEPVSGEQQVYNNSKSSFLEVAEGGVALLCLEGTPRFEQKFIRLALESSAEVRTDYGRIAPDRTAALDGQSEAQRIAALTGSRPSFTDTFFAPNRYAGYILGDIDASAFKPEELQALADRVREGAGLILLAGNRAFSSGGYADTPLADLFPVTLNPQERVPLAMRPEEFYAQLPEGNRPFRDQPVSMMPTELGAGHYLTQLSVDPAKNQEIWKELPALGGYWINGPLKPGAEVLAQVHTPDGGEGTPLLIIETFGSGRVALLAVDSTWRWALGGYGEEQKKFWRQLALWTADEMQLAPGELSITADKRRFHELEPVGFQILYRPEKEPKAGNEGEGPAPVISAAVRLPDGQTIPVPLAAEKGESISCTGQFSQTLVPGDYEMNVSVRSGPNGETLREGRYRFLVEAVNLELDRPSASPAVLHTLAAATGGEMIEPDRLSEGIGRMAEKGGELVEMREVRRTLYDTWPIFIMTVLILSGEWFLRKKWGLV